MSDIDITSATMDILQGPMMTTNEAAERLWEAIDANWEDSQPPRELFDEALAAERRAALSECEASHGDIRRSTVERIRAEIVSQTWVEPRREDNVIDLPKVYAILDEEAAR